jgi:alpha-1,2-mannosyltransferase
MADPAVPAPSRPLPVAGRWPTRAALGMAAAGAVCLAVAIVALVGSDGWGYDFAAYYDAARRVAEGGTPYQPETLDGSFRPGPGGLYLYSPVPAVALLPMAALELPAAVAVWAALRLGLLAATCALMPVSRNVRLATFGVAAFSVPLLIDLNLGNVSLIVTFLAVVVWRWLDRPLGSVALAAALAIRPTLGVVIVWWALRRQWRPIAWTVLAGLVIVALTLPFVGLEGYAEYVTVLGNMGRVTGVANNWDLSTTALRLGVPPVVASLALFAGYGLALVAAAASLLRDRELSYVVTVTSTLLLSPLLWDHYLVLLLIPAAFVAGRGRVWALALPLLTWLPQPALPFLAIAGMLLPFVAPARGARAIAAWRAEPRAA